MYEIGSRLRVHRRRLRLTLQEVHQRTGVSLSHLSQIERGLSQPSVYVLGKLADCYNVAVTLLPGNKVQIFDLTFPSH